MLAPMFSRPVHGVSFLRDTKTIGELSELIVAVRLAQAGYIVARPYGENCRYDLLIDDGACISRVQVKTGRLRNGVILFNAYSSHTHRKGVACRPYTNQIEYFGVYCPELDSAYLVPIGDMAPLSGTLRVDATKNGPHSHVRWAERYLVAPRRPVSFEALEVGGGAAGGVTESGSATPS